jgi:hypothetical protein
MIRLPVTSKATHRDAFAASPDRYTPQFGGYIAKRIADGNQNWRRLHRYPLTPRVPTPSTSQMMQTGIIPGSSGLVSP